MKKEKELSVIVSEDLSKLELLSIVSLTNPNMKEEADKLYKKIEKELNYLKIFSDEEYSELSSKLKFLNARVEQGIIY